MPKIIENCYKDALTVNGNHKKIKRGLMEEGFHPGVITDPLYYLESSEGYVPMTQDIFNSITEGRIRL